MIRIDELTPQTGLEAHIDAIARLRIAVFREWPYLYDGDLDYERRYLSAYVRSAGAICIAAFDGDRMVGASTGMPMTDEHDPIKAPFAAAGYDLGRIYYCAESILLSEYRGQGIYRRFFEGRETRACALGGFEISAFCGVVRPADHPLRPADYTPLDAIWRHFGYAPAEGLVCRFSWKDIDQEAATEKPLQFWLKRLEPKPLNS